MGGRQPWGQNCAATEVYPTLALSRAWKLALTNEYQKMCGVSDWKNMSWKPRKLRTRLYSTCGKG